jgi:hypothetical protein
MTLLVQKGANPGEPWLQHLAKSGDLPQDLQPPEVKDTGTHQRLTKPSSESVKDRHPSRSQTSTFTDIKAADDIGWIEIGQIF